MNGIKFVTFDVGGTLSRGKLDRRLYQQRVVEYLKLQNFEVSPKDFSKATGKALAELASLRSNMLEMKFDDFCLEILKNLRIAPSGDLLKHMWVLYLGCFPQRAQVGAKWVLEKLSGSYGLAVISNSMSQAPKLFLESSGLIRHFRTVVTSGDVGYRKPHPLIFRRALDELGAEPAETVHVGNLLEEDVRGAKGIGMHSVFITAQTIEGADVEPDLAVSSLREVPLAVEGLANQKLRDFTQMLGGRCAFCSSRQFCIYKLDPEGGEEVDNYVLLCPSCKTETLRRPPRPRKHGKYRAVYRRAWLELHAPKGRQ